jgi:hypothetical protein
MSESDQVDQPNDASPIDQPTASPRRPGCGARLLLLGVLTFVGVIFTVIVTIGIWPGEAKLTAPLFCPDDKPDVYVVTDSYSVRPGETSYNFTLYCMGPRGEIANQGFFQPFVVLALAHTALIAVVVIASINIHHYRKTRRARSDASPLAPA